MGRPAPRYAVIGLLGHDLDVHRDEPGERATAVQQERSNDVAESQVPGSRFQVPGSRLHNPNGRRRVARENSHSSSFTGSRFLPDMVVLALRVPLDGPARPGARCARRTGRNGLTDGPHATGQEHPRTAGNGATNIRSTKSGSSRSFAGPTMSTHSSAQQIQRGFPCESRRSRLSSSMVEQWTFNPLVLGSSPRGGTTRS